ncbi:MAG: TIGR03960 family B12-binding radical SAM protein [Oscillospiraceae bacterium]|nr:TIGR03960 family B12-binding radical SAM protein [Oscillospiraceae bacterium]
MDKIMERILPRVQKPARYTGGEYGQTVKELSAVKTRFAFCFPDTYEIGMSNLGMRILYGVLNEMEGVWCERVFAPWGDMEDQLRKNGIPLYTLESGDPVRDFDIVAFSLGYEMAYTNVLNMLDLAGLPIRAEDRGDGFPLVIAGGTSCLNPEPLAAFIDLFLLGEGEESLPELVKIYEDSRLSGETRESFLKKAAKIEGIYVPSLYEVSYNGDGTIKSITPKDGAPKKIRKRIIKNLDAAFFPDKTIIPSTEIVHDREVLELFRGCIRGCRFCQAGYVYRPVRRRSPEVLAEHARASLDYSGYEEMTLSSLSTSDYRGLRPLCDDLLAHCEARSVSLSLPSLRADNFSVELMERVQKVRRTGLTFAPEAGSQRLRDVINKNVREEDLLNTCGIAFEGGWNTIKLYFMLGLPTETDEDVTAINDLVNKVVHVWHQRAKNKARGLRITVSTSCFVPKPHTPFQWEAQVTREEYMRRVALLRSVMRSKSVTYNWHDADTSYIEACLSRGDRKMGDVLEKVWRTGGKLDAWSEYFSMERWLNAFISCGVSPEFYAFRERGEDEVFPWSHIDVGVEPEFFLYQRHEAYNERVTPDCRAACLNCGALSLCPEVGCDA